MAAISQEVTPEAVLPLVAHNVVVNGYRQGRPTEFLILFSRYLVQARQLLKLAGPERVIRVPRCADAGRLLEVLGYRLAQGCETDASIETADANQAFLTINSGFPLSDLEQAIREGKPFVLPYATSELPVRFTQKAWIALTNHHSPDLIDAFLRDPRMARLYWAMSRLDTGTCDALRKSPGLKKLLRYGPELDFFGAHITIRSGRVVVPGGNSAEPIWSEMVGASPESPANFVIKLLAKDDGWLADYFDSLSYTNQARQAYFTDPRRLRRFYEAYRGHSLSPNPTRHAFRPDQGLFFLVNRLQFGSNGQPLVPGNLRVWQIALNQKGDSKIIRDVAKRAVGWTTPEDLVDGMFSVARVLTPKSPLDAYLTLSEIDQERPPTQRLDPRTAHLLAEQYSRMGDQYLIFSEFPGLDNVSIRRFITVAQSVTRMKNLVLRSDVLGTFEANVGLWQILARQGEIPTAELNRSWQRVVSPFATIQTSTQLYDAARTSLGAMLRAANREANLSEDGIIALLSGPNQTTPEGQQVRQQLADRMRTVMQDQRLVSLDTIFALGDALVEMGKGVPMPHALVAEAKALQEFEMPRPLFSSSERLKFAPGLINNHHTASEMQTNLVKSIQAAASPAQAAEVRGELAPFLRDTLVGLNYGYYEPPGAQMLLNNPLFVRSHDFSGRDFTGQTSVGEQIWTAPHLFGQGWTAGGGAHLVGSLADLPYVLAKVEENFVVPTNVQSLIWEEMVPDLITSAILPRWWGISRHELHAVALYQRTGEELLAAAARDATVRGKVMDILSDSMLPRRLENLEDDLQQGRFQDALQETLPAETFYLTVEFRRRFPGDRTDWGPAGQELENLLVRYPKQTSPQRLSRDFGVPHPVLAQNDARELLNLQPVPLFMNYSSRLLGEWWESNNLYFARLADELGYPPVMLNRLIPQLTKRMVEETFASDLQDWPALLRAMRKTGQEFLAGKLMPLQKTEAASGL